MPDFQTSLPTINYDPNAGMQMLSGVIGIKAKQLDIQRGQQELQQQQIETQKQQQLQGERARITNMMSSGVDDQGNSIRDANGEPDLSKVIPAITRLAPLSGQQYAQNLIQTKTNKVGLDASSASLDASERKMLMGPVQAAAVDPNMKAADINAGIDNLVKAHPEMGNAATYLKGLVSHIDNLQNPAQRAQLVQGIAAHLQPGEQVETQPTAATIDTGGQIQPGTTAPPVTGGGFTPGGGPITKTTPPAVTTAPGGQVVTVAPGGRTMSPVGVSVPNSPRTAGASGSPGAPPSKLPPMQRPGLNAPRADIENYNARVKQLGDEYQTVSGAAADPVNGVQSTRFRNQQILDLIPHADTGPGMRLLNTMASRLPGSTGDAYQDLEHYTAQNSAAMAGMMNVPKTNLGAETAGAAAGNVERNPGALKEITLTNDALNTAMDLYNRGLAKVTNNGSDMTRAAAYKQAFGQNVDINAIRLADAHRRGDQEESSRLSKVLGPNGMRAAQDHLKTLKSLAENGDLP